MSFPPTEADKKWARNHVDCNVATCPEPRCMTRGICQDRLPYLENGPIPIAPADDLVNPKTLMGARRVDISLLPAAGIIHGSHAMMDGAAKYNPYNWREKKVPARTYISAAMRHLLDYLDGEETATDSGVHHLGHVIGCCAIVLDAMETGNLIDDRPTKGTAAAILARLEKALTARGARAP